MSIKKRLFLGVVLIATGTMVALLALSPRTVPEDPLPDPNGYDDFLKAGTLLCGNEVTWPDLSISELRSMVATNQAALELIRTGLTKHCRVVPYSATATWNSHDDNLVAAKRVGHAFAGASRLAILDGHTNEAANLALDCIRYGNELARGGVVMDSLVGIADQYIGRKSLEEALPGADAETSRLIVSALDRVMTEREQCADVFKREAQWARRGRFGPSGFFSQLLQPILQRGMRVNAEKKFTRILNDLQRTKVHAAAHAYELDHGKPPTASRELVPAYLKSVPVDSTTGKEIQLN